MSYTPEQLREDAHRADGIGTMADGDQLRAHADALEKLTKLKAHAEAMERDLCAMHEWAERIGGDEGVCAALAENVAAFCAEADALMERVAESRAK